MPRVTAAMVAGGRVVGEPRLGPDGSTVAFVSSARGRSDLVLVPAAGGAELVLTTDPAPCSARADGGGVFDWLPDGRGLVYAAKDGGLWLQPTTGGPPGRVVAPHADGSAAAPAVSPDGTRVAYVVGERHVAVASLDPHGPWPIRLTSTADFAFDPTWSPDALLVAWHEWDDPDMPWDASRIALNRSDGTGDVEVVAGGAGVAVAQPRFGPDGRLGFLCDARTGWLNVWVAEADGTGARPLVEEATEHGGPSWGQGIRTWCWSPDGAAVAYRTNEDGFSELYVDGKAIDRGVHHALSWVGSKVAAIRTGARTPTQLVVHDLDTGSRTTVARGPVAGWEAVGLPEPEVVRWDGDGGSVTGRLYLPAGVERPPVLCWIHGGPTDQWMVTFNPRFAFFLDRGWAILVPDHRGSTGHGRAWTQALRGRWGAADVDDCAAGLRRLAALGRVDVTRMVAMGSSAGAMTVLLLLAHHPDLCAAGVALFPVCDLVDLATSTHRFEAHYTDGLVGVLPDDRALLLERSPLTHADAITAPLLLLHGTDDPVVPVAQSEALAARLRALGRDVDFHVYDGEGHGWGNAAVVLDELARIERFLDRI